MFCDLLKDLRAQRKITQTELAQAIGVSNGNVGDWERGRSKPGYDALAALSRYFEISAEYLLELNTSTTHKTDEQMRKQVKELLCDGSPLSDEEADLIAMYRLLPDHKKEDAFDITYTFYQKHVERKMESIYWTYKEDRDERSDPAGGHEIQGGTA